MSVHYSKLFGCNIHGSIRVNPMALKIINTPEFQRMREIKQLGLCHFVYPAATHTRFEHSIGVYYLAGKMLDKIQQMYPDKFFDVPELGGQINLNPKIIECIKIGALCHDIGHGPFSHIFDDYLLKNSIHPNKEHETRSCLIMEMLCRRELNDELNDDHIRFIKSIINPEKKHIGALYQIVSNYLNGIDVDKFDYLARDAINLGLANRFDANRLINEFIIDDNNNISYPKHSSHEIYEMFHTRYMMHKKVYSHKTAKLIEVMLGDIFIKIDPIFKISDSIMDMSKFCKLVDHTIFDYLNIIIDQPSFIKVSLKNSEWIAINEAKEIYQRIMSRNLYRQINELTYDAVTYFDTFINEFIKMHDTIKNTDFQIIRTQIGFVRENKPNPFDTIYFYDKKEKNKSFTLSKNYMSGVINNSIQEIHTHLICKQISIYLLVVEEFNKFLDSHK